MNHLLSEADVITRHTTVTSCLSFDWSWLDRAIDLFIFFGLFLCLCVWTFLAICSLRAASSRPVQVETVYAGCLATTVSKSLSVHHFSLCAANHITADITAGITSVIRQFSKKSSDIWKKSEKGLNLMLLEFFFFFHFSEHSGGS